MTPFKKLCAIALTVLACTALAACGDSANGNPSTGGSSGASSGAPSSSGASSGGSSSGGSSSGSSGSTSSGSSSSGGSSSGGSGSGSSSGASGSGSGSSSGSTSSGGSSSGGSSSGGSSSGSNAAVLPFFKESRGAPGHNGNELWLAPVDDPAHPTMLVDGLTDGDFGRLTLGGDSQLVITYDRDTGSGAVSNRKPAKLVYLDGGKLYAVDLGSGQSRTPVQVSSLGGLQAICEQFTDGTLVNTWLRVSTSNAGNTACNYSDEDAETHLVKLNTPSSQPGIKLAHTAGSPHTQRIRSGLIGKNGSFAGFLVTDTNGSGVSATGKLCIYDAAFANPQCPLAINYFNTSANNAVLGVTRAFAPSQGSVVYLRLSDASFATHLYRFVTDTSTVEATAVTDALSIANPLADADGLYYVSGAGGGTSGETVYTLKHSDGAATAPVALYLAQDHVTLLGASDTRLILTEQDTSALTNPKRLESISKTVPSTNATVLDTAQSDPLGTPSTSMALYSRSLVVAGDRLFFNHTVLTDALSLTGGSIDYKAVQIQADGSGKSTLAGSAWVGSVGNGSTPGHIVLAKLINGDKQLALFSYKTSDGSQVAKLGTLAEAPTPGNNWNALPAQAYLYATLDLRQSYLGRTGNAFLFAYESLASNKAQADADLYFANVTKAGSLSLIASGEMGSNQPIE